MVVVSLVETARSERLKKHVFIPGEDEYQCSSGPLNDFVLLSVLNAMPSKVGVSKRRTSHLKRGYVADLVREGGVSPCGVLLGLIYIQRLAANNPAYLTTMSPRLLFLIAMVVASKYLNDEGEMEALTNSDWASLGGVSKPVLDQLERSFLKASDWKLYVSLEEFYSFVNSVEGRLALDQAMRRGWLSYTDLVAVWNSSDDYYSMLQYTTKVAFTGATLYLVCISTLLAAAHSLGMNSATPTVSSRMFSATPSSSPGSSLSDHTLQGLPLDNSSKVWSPGRSPGNSRGHGGLVTEAKLLLGVMDLEPLELTRSLLQPGDYLLNKGLPVTTLAPSLILASHRPDANIDLLLDSVSLLKARIRSTIREYVQQHQDDQLANNPQGSASKNSQDQLTNYLQDQPADNPRDQVAVNPQDQPTNYPQCQQASNPQDQPISNPQDQLASNPQDQLASNPQDQLASNPQDELASDTRDQLAVSNHHHSVCDFNPVASLSMGWHIGRPRVRIPQAVDLGYNRGTLHWNLQLNDSSWSEEKNVGVLYLMARYFMSS